MGASRVAGSKPAAQAHPTHTRKRNREALDGSDPALEGLDDADEESAAVEGAAAAKGRSAKPPFTYPAS